MLHVILRINNQFIISAVFNLNLDHITAIVPDRTVQRDRHVFFSPAILITSRASMQAIASKCRFPAHIGGLTINLPLFKAMGEENNDHEY